MPVSSEQELNAFQFKPPAGGPVPKPRPWKRAKGRDGEGDGGGEGAGGIGGKWGVKRTIM